MTNAEGQNADEATDKKLREYCVRVIRFLSDSMLDPHLYFDKKLTGDVTVAESTEALLGILIGLSECIEEIYGTSAGLSRMDQALGRDGLPTLSLLCAPATRTVGLVLACDRIRTTDEYRRVTEFIGNTSITDSDRCIAERLLADHEQT